jgi:DNA polymerase III epsilon subunit-like protein
MASYRAQEEALLERALRGAPLLFVDFEASSLNQKRSYPIEFGWQRVVGGEARDRGAFLIRTAPVWDVPGAWTDEASRVHGITRAAIDREGLDPADAASRTLDLIGDAVVVGDAPSYDRHWWRVLLDQLPGKPKPPVMIDLDELGMRVVRGDEAKLHAARADASERRPATHRAEQDAMHLAERWLALQRLLRVRPSSETRPAAPGL